jgi:phospholipid-binding lipoprotein MlaA
VKWEITGLQLVNTRAGLLGASKVLDDIALDKYTFVRDAYLQRRRSLVYDGDAPERPEEAIPADEKKPSAPAAKPDAAAKPASAPDADKTPPASPPEPPPPPK